MATEQEVTAYGSRLASQYGLTITNQRRSPERNRQVGGAKNSDHLTGLALDLSGDQQKMASLASWARQNMGPGKLFRWVGWGDSGHKDHVHLSFNAASDINQGTVSAASASEAVVADIDNLPPDSTPEQIEAWIRKNMPMVEPFLANPEIRAILVRGDIDELGDLEVEQLLRNTTYWQTHGPDSRAFDRLIGTDKQAAGQAVDNAKNVLGDYLAKQGVNTTDEQLGEAAKKAIRAGWINLEGQPVNTAALADFAVFALGNQAGGGQIAAGETAFTADQLGTIAREYLVPLTRRQLEQWALDVTAGKQSEESFRSWMTGLAKARFGSDADLSGAIERGLSPSQFFQGHIATVANILELDDTQIDLMDPKWMPLIETVDGTGKRRAPTLGEVAQWARNQEGFKNTRAYKQTEAELGIQLARSMGALA